MIILFSFYEIVQHLVVVDLHASSSWAVFANLQIPHSEWWCFSRWWWWSLSTFRFHVKDDDVRTSHQHKNDMFEEAEMFSHQLAFGVVAKPHLSIGVSVALGVCCVSKSSVDLMKFHKHCWHTCTHAKYSSTNSELIQNPDDLTLALEWVSHSQC